MSDPNPAKTVQEMFDYAEDLSETMLSDMSDEDSIAMVRDYCSVMADWQPNIAERIADPAMLAIMCLCTTYLFRKSFKRAYNYTDKKVEAMEALKKAFGDES